MTVLITLMFRKLTYVSVYFSHFVGRLVSLGAALTSVASEIGLSSNVNRAGRGNTAGAASTSAATALRSVSAAVQSVPAERDILCASWASPRLLLLGLSGGDTLLVQIRDPSDSSNISSSNGGGALQETMLRDVRTTGTAGRSGGTAGGGGAGGTLQALLTGFIGRSLAGGSGGDADAATDDSSNYDTISIGAVNTQENNNNNNTAAMALAVNRRGELRVWGLRAQQQQQQLYMQSSLYSLLEAVGAAGQLLLLGSASARNSNSNRGYGASVNSMNSSGNRQQADDSRAIFVQGEWGVYVCTVCIIDCIVYVTKLQ